MDPTIRSLMVPLFSQFSVLVVVRCFSNVMEVVGTREHFLWMRKQWRITCLIPTQILSTMMKTFMTKVIVVMHHLRLTKDQNLKKHVPWQVNSPNASWQKWCPGPQFWTLVIMTKLVPTQFFWVGAERNNWWTVSHVCIQEVSFGSRKPRTGAPRTIQQSGCWSGNVVLCCHRVSLPNRRKGLEISFNCIANNCAPLSQAWWLLQIGHSNHACQIWINGFVEIKFYLSDKMPSHASFPFPFWPLLFTHPPPPFPCGNV